MAFKVDGFNAEVLDFVSLSGDLRFRLDGVNLLVVGLDMTARLEVDPSVYVELAGADLGLITGVDGFAFELTGGALDLQLGPLFDISDVDVNIQFAGISSPVIAPLTIDVGLDSYAFSDRRRSARADRAPPERFA